MQPQSPSSGRLVAWLGAPSRAVRNRARLRSPLTWTCWTLLAGMLVWDVWLAADGADGNTWSEVTRAAGTRYPVLPWMFA